MNVRSTGLFSEPSGWAAARIHLVSAVAFFGIYAYFELRHDSGLASVLVVGIAAALSGVAEFLPKHRRRTAGALRVTAIGILAILLGLAVSRLVA